MCVCYRKYEEIYPPDVSQFAYITDNTYKVGQILRMEHLILKVLSFDMAVPTAHFFVNKFCRLLKNPEEVVHLALVSVSRGLLLKFIGEQMYKYWRWVRDCALRGFQFYVM